MLSYSLPPSSRNQAFITTERLAPRVLTTSMGGYITEELCAAQRRQFEKLVHATPGATWVIEVKRITGFDARAVKAGAEWFTTFKQGGGERILYVSQSAPARMAAQALGFGAGIPVRCLPDMENAVGECCSNWD